MFNPECCECRRSCLEAMREFPRPFRRLRGKTPVSQRLIRGQQLLCSSDPTLQFRGAFPKGHFSFLPRSKVSTCLLLTDPRSQYSVRLPHKLPGMHYSADEQCQILFGTNATFCKNMEVRARGLSLETRWEVEIKLPSPGEEKRSLCFPQFQRCWWKIKRPWAPLRPHPSFPTLPLVISQSRLRKIGVCTLFPFDIVFAEMLRRDCFPGSSAEVKVSPHKSVWLLPQSQLRWLARCFTAFTLQCS